MNRRTFIAGLGSAAAWPVVAWAQTRERPMVAYLYAGKRIASLARGRLPERTC